MICVTVLVDQHFQGSIEYISARETCHSIATALSNKTPRETARTISVFVQAHKEYTVESASLYIQYLHKFGH